MPSEKELEEYEKEYLKRYENQKKENSVTKTEEEKKEKKEVSELLKNLRGKRRCRTCGRLLN